jgi:hypothetical protein
MKTWLNSDQSIRRPALIAGAGALCLIAGFSLFSEPSKRVLSSAAQNIPHTTTAFFTIAGTNGMSQTGTAQPNDNGDFALPALNLGQYKNSSIAYTLELEDQNTDINFLLRYDHTDKNLDLKAAGLRAFSDISYTINGHKQVSKTDWAGLFHAENVLNTASQVESAIELAFNGFDVRPDSPQDNSSLIKIQLLTPQSSGGSNNTAFDGSVNQASPTGDPLISTRNSGELQKQIQNLVKNFTHPMMLAAEQLSAVMLQYMQIIGSFIDADEQMDTQRDLQVRQAQAHKDYHPSQQMCVFGTLTRSMNNAQGQANYNAVALNKIMMDRYTLKDKTSSSSSPGADLKSRAEHFIDSHCNPGDQGTGLEILCELASEKPPHTRMGTDVDYPDTVLRPLTLNINFENQNASTDEEKEEQETEEGIIALAKNLYWFDSFSIFPKEELKDRYASYQNVRQVLAMHSVAHNTFTHMIGMKAKGIKTGEGTAGGVFMKDFMKILLGDGATVTPEDILGDNPSYYAMMEVMTKKLYQDGSFYTNLYDKPVNVARIKTSLQAIQLMQNRDRYESALRREMLSSLLLENALIPEQERVQSHQSYLVGLLGL